jgi:hypothetical protein
MKKFKQLREDGVGAVPVNVAGEPGDSKKMAGYDKMLGDGKMFRRKSLEKLTKKKNKYEP